MLLVFGCLLSELCGEDFLSASAVHSYGLVSCGLAARVCRGQRHAEEDRVKSPSNNIRAVAAEVRRARASFCSARVGTGT